jgi:hypothetical protein
MPDDGHSSLLDSVSALAQGNPMAACVDQKNTEHYQRLVAESQLVLTKHRKRHNELLRLLLEAAARAEVKPPLQDS